MAEGHEELSISDSASQEGLKREAVEWLLNKWGANKSCPMCGTQTWSVSGVGGISEWIPESGFIPESAYPVIPVHCTYCGFVALINAVAAGIVIPRNAAEGGEK